MAVHTFQGENPLTKDDVVASLKAQLGERGVPVDEGKLDACCTKFQKGCAAEHGHELQ